MDADTQEAPGNVSQIQSSEQETRDKDKMKLRVPYSFYDAG